LVLNKLLEKPVRNPVFPLNLRKLFQKLKFWNSLTCYEVHGEKLWKAALKLKPGKPIPAGKKGRWTFTISVVREAYKNEPWTASVCKEFGHVVVKVFDEGRQFRVYVLSAADESGTVKAVFSYRTV
jgi:hypothetical protein